MKKWLRRLRPLLAMALVGMMSTQVYATSLEDAQGDKEKAENEKNSAQEILRGLEKEKADVQNYIAEMDKELAAIQDEILSLNEQRDTLNAEIEQKQVELEQAKIDEANQYEAMCERIRFMYESGNTDYMATLLTAEDMCDFLNQPEYISSIADYDYKMLEEMVATREAIANAEQMLQVDLKAVEETTAKAEAREADLDLLIADKTETLNQYEDEIARTEKVIAACDAAVEAAAARIAEIERAAAQNSNFVPYSGGALLWPTTSTRITSYFGYRTPSGIVNANHKGIDIGAKTGTPIYAAASGVVVRSEWERTGSAGNWVIISHGNGFYTLYMHASKLLVSEGDYVNQGDTIALVGSTGNSTGPHLHFGVAQGGYSSQFTVDPLQYFQ